MPATWSRCQWLSTTVNSLAPSSSSASRTNSRVLDRDVGVVDERLRAVHDRVAGDPELDRPLVHPVRALGEPVSRDAPVVEGEHAVGGPKHAGAMRQPGGAPTRSTRSASPSAFERLAPGRARRAAPAAAIQLQQRRQHEAARGDLRVRQRQADGLELHVTQQQQVEVDGAGAVPGGRRSRGRARPRSPCRRPAGPPGSSAVRMRATAFRKSGWSRTSPTGSVSYREETASTSTPWSRSPCTAAASSASRSPTLEPRPM